MIHGFLAALQVIQQRAVRRGELAAEVLARLEQTGGSPAMQGPLAHAQAIRGLTLHGPVGVGVIGVDAKDRSSGDRRSAIDPSADPAKGDGCVQE